MPSHAAGSPRHWPEGAGAHPLLRHVRSADAAERVAFDLAHAGGGTLTWGELDALSRRWAAALDRLGVPTGSRVAVALPSGREALIALVGALRSGRIHVPVNLRYRGEEIAHVLTDCDASAVLAARGDAEALRVAESHGVAHRVAVEVGEGGVETAHFDGLLSAEAHASPPRGDETSPTPETVAMLVYTSGTTGRSKGVMLTHGGLVANVGATTGHWRFAADDRLVLTLPLFHVHGLGLGALGTLLHGLTCLVHARFDADRVLADFAERGATVFMGVPTLYARLLTTLESTPARAAALRRARLFTSGSAALPASDFERFEALTGHRILERYGMTETGFTLSNPYEPAAARRPGHVGHPVPGLELRLVDEGGAPTPPGEPGELQVRGAGLMAGYWGRPDATAESFVGGWFRTGDVAVVTEGGDRSPTGLGPVRIVGRRSVDIIKSGGFKVSALEIEDVLLRHPAVAEAAVVGVPHTEWGEQIVAAVVRTDGAGAGDDPDLEAALAEHVGVHLAGFKKPRHVTFIDKLPRNALGKLQKPLLKAWYTRRAGGE